MPKPQGTFLRIQNQEKIRLAASRAKMTLGLSRDRNLVEFYEALDRMADHELDSLHRSMVAIAADIKENDAISKEDKIRKTVSEALEKIREILETAQDLKQLEGRMQVPVHSIIKAPVNLGSTGVELALVIALCQVLEVFVRLRKRGPR